mgnify:CR=1 FL=1
MNKTAINTSNHQINKKTKAIMVAIEVSSILKDKKLETRLVSLAESDKNLKIRDAAIKALQSTYNISI